jgi:DNA helicase-2/ATP-dependent DNA helicase PcrA
MDTYASSYATPGWQRAQARRNAAGGNGGNGRGGFSERANSWGKGGGSTDWNSSSRRGPMQIDGELVATSTGKSAFAKGARVFHLKFGPGTVALVDGNKLTVDFDKAGRKMVLESFVQAV